MSHAARIKRNSVFAFLSHVTRLTTNLLVVVGIARFFGPEAFGQFTTALTFSTLFLIFADFGFDTLLAVEVAKGREQVAVIARRYLSMKIVTAACSSTAMLSVPVFHPVSETTRTLIYIFAAYVLFTSLLNFFFALFKGFERLEHESRISFVANVVALCCLALIGFFRLPLYAFAIVFVVTRVLGLALAVRTSSVLLHHQWFRFSFEGWSEVRWQVLTFGVYVLFGILYFQMDTILLALWKGDKDVGIYQAVFRVILLVSVILDVAISTLMPTLSRLHGEDHARWTYVGHLLYKTLFFAAMPISIFLFVYAEQVIGLFYGKEAFAESIPILRIFAVIAFIRFAAEPFGLMLTTGHRQTARMAIIIAAAILNFALNAYFIPKSGPLGAAKVSLVTNALVAFGYIFATSPFLGSWVFDMPKIGSFLLGLTVALFLWQVRSTPLWVIGVPSMVSYALVSYFILYSKEERTMLFSFKTQPTGDWLKS